VAGLPFCGNPGKRFRRVRGKVGRGSSRGKEGLNQGRNQSVEEIKESQKIADFREIRFHQQARNHQIFSLPIGGGPKKITIPFWGTKQKKRGRGGQTKSAEIVKIQGCEYNQRGGGGGGGGTHLNVKNPQGKSVDEST